MYLILIKFTRRGRCVRVQPHQPAGFRRLVTQSGHQHGPDASARALIQANLFATLLFSSC